MAHKDILVETKAMQSIDASHKSDNPGDKFVIGGQNQRSIEVTMRTKKAGEIHSLSQMAKPVLLIDKCAT